MMFGQLSGYADMDVLFLKPWGADGCIGLDLITSIIFLKTWMVDGCLGPDLITSIVVDIMLQSAFVCSKWLEASRNSRFALHCRVHTNPMGRGLDPWLDIWMQQIHKLYLKRQASKPLVTIPPQKHT